VRTPTGRRSRALLIVVVILALEGLVGVVSAVGGIVTSSPRASVVSALLFGGSALWVASGLARRPAEFRRAGLALVAMQIVGVAVMGWVLAASGFTLHVITEGSEPREVPSAAIKAGLVAWGALCGWMVWVLVRVRRGIHNY
jgi:hypothetical protein